MRKKKEKDDEIRLFWQSASQLPHTQRYVRNYSYELPGSIILSVCLVCFCSFLAIIQVIHNYGIHKICIAIPK